MKNIIIISCCLAMPFLVQSQYFEIRTFLNDLDYLNVEMRDTTNSGIVNTSAEIVDMQFEVRWPKSLGADVDVKVICTNYDIWRETLGYRGEEGDYYYRVFSAYPLAHDPYKNWVKNEWQTLVKLEVTSASSNTGGSFTPAPNTWVVEDLNLNIDGIDYDVHVTDSIMELPYPTIVYKYVWEGGQQSFSGWDENSWGNGLNWADPCGSSIYGFSQPPTDTSNCVIPGDLTYYPTNFNNQTSDSIRRLRLQPGALLVIPGGITLVALKNLINENGANLEVITGGKLEVKDQ